MVDFREFKGDTIFQVYKVIVERELEKIKTYLAEISHDLSDKQRELTDSINSGLEAAYQVSEDEPDIYGIFGEELDKYFTHFPTYTYNSILLIVYGQFENWIRRFCEIDHVKKLSLIQISDLYGNNYIEKSRTYLEKIAGIDFYPIITSWERITEIQKIRNAIAHNNSNIIFDKDKELLRQPLYQIVRRNPEITLDERSGDFFIKSEVFILEIIDLISGPLNFILDELEKRRVVAKTIHMSGDAGRLFQVKTEAILNGIVKSLNVLDKSQAASEDERINMKLVREQLNEMAIEGSRVYAFFSGGEWNEKDAEFITEQREKGLHRLKNIYQSGRDVLY